jgi:hypothetical protein
VVTIASVYGAGESVIAPAVAQRLDVPLLDREIPQDAARRSGVPQDAVADVDEEPRSRTGRLLFNLARATTVSSPRRVRRTASICRSAGFAARSRRLSPGRRNRAAWRSAAAG